MKTISQRTIDLRRKLGVSQAELGRRINYSRAWISLVELGKKKDPDQEFVDRIAALEQHGTEMPTTQGSYASEVRIREQPPTLRKEPQQNMGPPHYFPDRPAPPASSRAAPSLQHSDYAQTVSWLSYLFDRDPDAFRTVMGYVQGVMDISTTKSK